MNIDVYTDGACSKNGKSDSRASWAFYFPSHSRFSSSGRVPDGQLQTNQRAELMAISECVQASEKHFDVSNTYLHIYTDSMYSKKCLTEWISAWIRNKWRTSQGGDVQHRDLIEDTYTRLSKFKSFSIIHVKAHTGNDDDRSKNNHIVDRLAASVLNPEEKEKVVTNVQEVLQGCPLTLLGPPLSEDTLVDWCLEHMELLDKKAVSTAIITAFAKTIRQKGFDIVKQRLHRSTMYRLKTETGLIKEGSVTIKDE
uniref:ribonuclease H n=1 Tax=viral metagenome TaxID=1070528 RepID=A0A6C0JVQ9_9ZZZZ